MFGCGEARNYTLNQYSLTNYQCISWSHADLQFFLNLVKPGSLHPALNLTKWSRGQPYLEPKSFLKCSEFKITPVRAWGSSWMIQWIEPNHSEVPFEYSQKTSRQWGTWYRYHQYHSRVLWLSGIYRGSTGEDLPHDSKWSAERTLESWLWLWSWWVTLKRGSDIMLLLT